MTDLNKAVLIRAGKTGIRGWRGLRALLGGCLGAAWALAAIAEPSAPVPQTAAALAQGRSAVIADLPAHLLVPVAEPDLPATQWDHRPEAEGWTRAALDALGTFGQEVVATVPRDIERWCPAYPDNPPETRAAFWVGLMSAIAHYESRHIPDVVGGGNLYYGLMQIYPPTARSVGCAARSGEALLSGEANLSCAVRILAVVVPDHEAIALREGGWRGVANQWGPMTRDFARSEMAQWTRAQDYCQPQEDHAASRVAADPLRMALN